MKAKLILLLLFLTFPISSFAATVDYYIVLTNDDNVEIISVMLKGMNYFVASADYYHFIGFILFTGTAWALVQLMMASLSGNASQGFKQYFIYLLSLFFVGMLIYGPQSTVMVQTRDSGNFAINDKVPTFYAFTLSVFTEIRLALSDMTENAFNIPDPTDNFSSGGSGGLGFFGAQAAIASLATEATFRKAINKDETLAPKYDSFIRDCYILPAQAEDKLFETAIQKNFKLNIDPAVTTYSDELVTYNGRTGRCGDFWNNSATVDFGTGFVPLQTTIQNFENNISSGSKLGKMGSALAYYGAMMENNTNIVQASSVRAAVTQAVLSNEYRNVFSKMGVAGEVSAAGAAQAQAEMQIQGIATGLFVAQQIPRAAFILFALMVGSAPFLFAFALFPGTGIMLVSFLRTLLWISLWEPMGNILGVFQDYSFAKLLKENGYTALNDVMAMDPSMIVDISSEAASMAGIAGGMFVAIQGLSWMLITGSGQMMGNILSASAQSFKSHANAEAQMANSADMQEAAMMSKELGRSVSMREKYAFSANQQAAQNASQIGGAMEAHGTGTQGADSMSATGHVNQARQQATSIGMASATRENFQNSDGTVDVKAITSASGIRQSAEDGTLKGTTATYGNMKNAAATTEISSSEKTQTEVTRSKLLGSTRNAQNMGNLNSTQAFNKDEANFDTFDGDAAKAGEASYGNQKLASEIEKNTGNYTNNMNDKSFDAVATSLAGAKGPEATDKALGNIVKAGIAPDKGTAATQSITAAATKQTHATTDVNAETAGAGGSATQTQSRATNANIKGKMDTATAKVHNSNAEQQDSMVNFQVQKKVDSLYKEEEVNQEMVDAVDKKIDTTKTKLQEQQQDLKTAQNQNVEKNAQASIDSGTSSNQKMIQENRGDAEASQAFIKKNEQLQQQKETLKSLKNEDNLKSDLKSTNADIKQLKDDFKSDFSNAKSPEEKIALSQDFTKKNNELQGKKNDLEEKLENVEQLKKDSGADIEGMETKIAQTEQELSTLESKKDALDPANLGAITAEKDAVDLKALEKKNLTTTADERSSWKSSGDAADVVGEMVAGETSAQAAASMFINSGSGAVNDLNKISGGDVTAETLQHIASGNGTKEEIASLAGAVKATKHMTTDAVVDGKVVKASTDNSGNYETYKQESGQSYKEISNVQVNGSGWLASKAMSHGDDGSKVATVGTVKNVVDFGVDVVKSMTGSKIKKNLKKKDSDSNNDAGGKL